MTAAMRNVTHHFQYSGTYLTVDYIQSHSLDQIYAGGKDI